MNKDAIKHQVEDNYSSFIEYINGLSDEEYLFSDERKWNAGQQLAHIVLCVKPLVQVFAMDKTLISNTFGFTDRAGRTYDELLAEYLKQLAAGGKAPGRYIPEDSLTANRAALTGQLMIMIDELCLAIDGFTEKELDSLCIPHPLLGSLTLREMLYNAIYHVKHHQVQTAQTLHNKR